MLQTLTIAQSISAECGITEPRDIEGVFISLVLVGPTEEHIAKAREFLADTSKSFDDRSDLLIAWVYKTLDIKRPGE